MNKYARQMVACFKNPAQENEITAIAAALTPQIKAALKKAELLRADMRTAEAISLLEQSLAQNPAHSKICVNLAKLYRDLRMYRKAQEVLAEAVLANPHDPQPAKLMASFIQKKSVSPVRDSIGDIMLFVKKLGLAPATIIDVGVNTGTPGLFDFFPDAKLLMVDPIIESEVFMKKIASIYPDAHYQLVAAGAGEKEVVMTVHPSFGGSGIADIRGHADGGFSRTVPAKTLDGLAREYGAKGPYIIKIDVEGGEMHVLSGATGILAETELLILETRFKPFKNAPDFIEVLEKLREWGFMAWDFIDRNYNDNDDVLKQCDLIAVRQEGFFRTRERYKSFKKLSGEEMNNIIDAKLRSRDTKMRKIEGK